MYRPDLSPVADSLALSSLVAALPLLTLFVLLGWLRWKAHWAGLSALLVSIVVAVAVYDMPVDLAVLSGTEGAAFGLVPIMWIVVAALWVYQLTVVTGRFEDLRAAFGLVSKDHRVQALIIAFCFGALLEALAGFGAPVAITGVMLVALGFSPVRAAITVLVANTAPVAFGAIATPIITAGNLTQISYEEIGAYVGRQTPLLALFVPLILVAIVDGKRGVRQSWPVAVVCGASFAVAQFVSSNFLSVELTDIIASLVALAVIVGFLRFWQPEPVEAGAPDDPEAADAPEASAAGDNGGAAKGTSDSDAGGVTTTQPLTGARMTMAFLPYLIIIGVFALAKLIDPIEEFLLDTDVSVSWPGLDGEVATATGEQSSTTLYVFPWLSGPGSLLLLCGILVALVYRVRAWDAVLELGRTIATLKWALLTVASVLALAYVMNLSGQTITIGTWIAGAGAAFAFLSPILGWLGTAVTGSDTSANALFATLQQTAAGPADLDATLLVAANTSGGVVGKMISPQNLTIAATAVGLFGRESELFRKAIGWSLALLLALCVLIFLQAHVISAMLP